MPRSIDLESDRARSLIGESLLSLKENLRTLGLRTVTWLRLLAGGSFVVLAVLFGVIGGAASWRAMLPTALAYTLLVAGAAAAMDRAEWRRLLLPGTVLLDILVCFVAHLESLSLARNPAAVAGLALGAFALVVLVAALTLESAAQVAVATALAFVGEAVLLHRVGAEASVLLSVALLMGLTGLLAALAVVRLHRLAGQLVNEEVHRRLAIERGLELEKANERISQINAELEEQQQRLVLSQRDSETLASLLVHDMKQPLASVLGLIDVVAAELARLPGSAALQEDLLVARAQAQRLLAMIDDLLAISRLEKGTLEPRPEPTSPGPLLRSVAARLQHPGGLQVAVRAPEDLEAPLDRALTERMLENLLANALSFVKPDGAVELSASREGGELVLAVRNDGPPVPAELRVGLFDKSISRGGERRNAGLGLYFCRLVAEAHRGRIALEEDARFPVSFVVRLPVGAGPRPPAAR